MQDDGQGKEPRAQDQLPLFLSFMGFVVFVLLMPFAVRMGVAVLMTVMPVFMLVMTVAAAAAQFKMRFIVIILFLVAAAAFFFPSAFFRMMMVVVVAGAFLPAVILLKVMRFFFFVMMRLILFVVMRFSVTKFLFYLFPGFFGQGFLGLFLAHGGSFFQTYAYLFIC